MNEKIGNTIAGGAWGLCVFGAFVASAAIINGFKIHDPDMPVREREYAVVGIGALTSGGAAYTICDDVVSLAGHAVVDYLEGY